MDALTSKARVHAADAERGRRTLRVLIVDDNRAIRLVLARTLARDATLQVEVVGEASEGEEAVASVGRLLPDVVLMDVEMPTLNGIEATRRISSRFPAVVVFGWTARTDESVASAMRNAGALRSFVKNEELADLLEALRVLPANRDLRRVPD